jgi:hypothetical protein
MCGLASPNPDSNNSVASSVRRFLVMLAHMQGGLLNLSQLGNALDVSYHSVARYLDLLEGAFLIRRLPPYFRNVGKRLTKSPKVYIRDTGVLHHSRACLDRQPMPAPHPACGSWTRAEQQSHSHATWSGVALRIPWTGCRQWPVWALAAGRPDPDFIHEARSSPSSRRTPSVPGRYAPSASAPTAPPPSPPASTRARRWPLHSTFSLVYPHRHYRGAGSASWARKRQTSRARLLHEVQEAADNR